jgi:hypothetical protein
MPDLRTDRRSSTDWDAFAQPHSETDGKTPQAISKRPRDSRFDEIGSTRPADSTSKRQATTSRTPRIGTTKTALVAGMIGVLAARQSTAQGVKPPSHAEGGLIGLPPPPSLEPAFMAGISLVPHPLEALMQPACPIAAVGDIAAKPPATKLSAAEAFAPSVEPTQILLPGRVPAQALPEALMLLRLSLVAGPRLNPAILARAMGRTPEQLKRLTKELADAKLFGDDLERNDQAIDFILTSMPDEFLMDVDAQLKRALGNGRDAQETREQVNDSAPAA